MTHLYYTYLEREYDSLYLVASDEGLVFVSSFYATFEDVMERFPGVTLIDDEAKLSIYREQLIDYLEGRRTGFDFPLDIESQGTAFQNDVWRAMLEVPYGELSTYTQIAEKVSRPKAVRAVGGAIGKNPLSIVVPCHRIIGKNGSLTGYSGGMEMKKYLLRLEGHQID